MHETRDNGLDPELQKFRAEVQARLDNDPSLASGPKSQKKRAALLIGRHSPGNAKRSKPSSPTSGNGGTEPPPA